MVVYLLFQIRSSLDSPYSKEWSRNIPIPSTDFYRLCFSEGRNKQSLRHDILIKVTDYRGRRLSKVVWEDAGDAVVITSQDVLKRLKRGDFRLIPIRFPKDSVSVAKPRR